MDPRADRGPPAPRPDRPECLSPELNCRFAPGLISDRSRGAIGVKIGKMGQSPEGDHPWYTYWLLLEKRENIGIGLVGFKGPPDQDQQVEVGYGIAPPSTRAMAI